MHFGFASTPVCVFRRDYVIGIGGTACVFLVWTILNALSAAESDCLDIGLQFTQILSIVQVSYELWMASCVHILVVFRGSTLPGILTFLGCLTSLVSSILVCLRECERCLVIIMCACALACVRTHGCACSVCMQTCACGIALYTCQMWTTSH